MMDRWKVGDLVCLSLDDKLVDLTWALWEFVGFPYRILFLVALYTCRLYTGERADALHSSASLSTLRAFFGGGY